jgi:hypothetical protein
VSAKLYGDNKKRNMKSFAKSHKLQGLKDNPTAGYGGHFRAIQGFKYIGGINTYDTN